MLGQEDNPARLREEIERAQQQQPAPAKPVPAAGLRRANRSPRPAGPVRSPQLPGQERAAADGHHFGRRDDEPDLRPAGGDYRLELGVREAHCRVGQLVPGEGAWRADLKPGDEILKVNGRRVVIFGDILQAVIGDARTA